MPVEVLVQLVPQLMERIDHLEADVKTLKQSKETMGHAMVKLVKKVKKMEGLLKRRKIVLSESGVRKLTIHPNRGGIWKQVWKNWSKSMLTSQKCL